MPPNPQHLIYTAIPNFPARLSVVVDTQVWIKETTLKGSSISHPTQVTGTAREWRIRITQFTCSRYNTPST